MLCENGKERWVNSVSQAKKKKVIKGKQAQFSWYGCLISAVVLSCWMDSEVDSIYI